MMLLVFWVAVTGLVYVYVGYPLAARAWARTAGRTVRRAPIQPAVTVVITAYNEEQGIAAKLRNVAALRYPAGLLDVIVASDGSTDRTDAIVRHFHELPVTLLRVEGRRGKTTCQNAAAEAAQGEILLFTDATTRIEADALIAMVENFADPDVGCVAGSLVYVAKGDNLTARGGTSYWGYELALRQAESDLGSLVGVSGCLYAVRRSAYRPIRPDLISDFVVAFKMQEQGLRTVLEPRGLCFEDTHDLGSQELGMRVRVAIRSLHALVTERRFLNPLRYRRFAWQLWSHKALRYASPLLGVVTLAANVALVPRPFYVLTFGLQVVILGLGVLGWVLHGSGRQAAILEKPYYFLLTNAASLVAMAKYLRGERAITWTPVRGP